MDADDISYPDRLQLQFEFFEKNPAIDVVASQTAFVSDIPGSEGFSIFVDWQNSIIRPEDHALYRFIESPLAHPTVMFRRKLIKKFGLYSTRAVPDDYEMWLRWMDHGVPFYKIPQPLLAWNDHRIESQVILMASGKIQGFAFCKALRKTPWKTWKSGMRQIETNISCET
jgi:hypothetical protein